MNDQLISLFIDDELELEEKITFVTNVRDNEMFGLETLEMLKIERQLIDIPSEVHGVLPQRLKVAEPAGRRLSEFFADLFQPALGFAVALLLVAIVFPFWPRSGQEVSPVMENHRFVLYHPGSTEAKIVGSFTSWKPVTMQQSGTDGYWSVTLPLPPGEHRYSFLLEDNRSIPDPSISIQEMDDFGGKNSVITVGYSHDPLS